ncbi:MAG: hypothetical protein HY437_01095 [Candidatus Magasanikbacteria bacterium]|nr:hypothetical protein [Candidatus Magasanikbacteria bacterium]
MAHYLDRDSVYQDLDSEHVLLSLGGVPDQILQAWHEVGAMKIRPFRPSCVVVSGMGGSGLGPDIFRTAFGTRVRVPLIISNGYSLPGYVNAKSFVISVSYSGGTEETVAAYKEAGLRGARRFVITTGGTLARLAAADKVPCYKFQPRHNPSGQPRMGLGYPLGALAALIKKLRLANFSSDDITRTAAVAREVWHKVRFEEPYVHNPAKRLAETLEEKIPVFIATRFLGGALHAVTNQLQENAKHFSLFFRLPELNHHLLEALSFPRGITEKLHAVLFDSALANPLNRERLMLTRDVLRKQGVESTLFLLRAEESLAASLELLMLGGATGFYLALLHKQSPVKIPWVDYFKKHLH